MTAPPDDVREQLTEQLRRSHGQLRTVDEIADSLLPVVTELTARAAADAVTAVADAWQWGGWANTPRRADRVADRIGAAQYVTEWLRARAARLAAAVVLDPAPTGRTTQAGPWRVGRHYGIHVYEASAAGDDRPVATFHDPADAERAVRAVNAAGQPT